MGCDRPVDKEHGGPLFTSFLTRCVSISLWLVRDAKASRREQLVHGGRYLQRPAGRGAARATRGGQGGGGRERQPTHGRRLPLCARVQRPALCEQVVGASVEEWLPRADDGGHDGGLRIERGSKLLNAGGGVRQYAARAAAPARGTSEVPTREHISPRRHGQVFDMMSRVRADA